MTETQGYLGLPFTPGSDTSRAAAESALATVRASRRLVLDLLRASENGYTHEELCQAAGAAWADSGIRTRCNELVKAGLVVDSGQRRRTSHGRATVVWRIAPASEDAARIGEGDG